jgi:hypothetical protein
MTFREELVEIIGNALRHSDVSDTIAGFIIANGWRPAAEDPDDRPRPGHSRWEPVGSELPLHRIDLAR